MVKFGIALGLLAASPVFAYIPPTDFLVRTLVKKHDLGKGVRVKSTVSSMENENSTSVRFKETTVYDPRTATLRSWATDDSGQVLYAVEKKTKDQTTLDAVLFESTTPRVFHALKGQGIDVQSAEPATLARWRKSIAWVIGARDSSRGELWLEKDTFYPVRLILNEKAFDIELDGTRTYHEFPYPKVVTLDKGVATAAASASPQGKVGRGILRAETNEVAVNIEAQPPKNLSFTGFTDAGQAAPDALKELIRQYYRVVR